MKRDYPTNLTDNQHEAILRIIGDKRKRQHSFEHDSKSGYRVLKELKGVFGHIKNIYADGGGDRGELIDKVKDKLGCDMGITLQTDKSTDFKPLPKRWVIERSVAWLDDFRRLAKDYERRVTCAGNMIYLAFISLMLQWL